MIKLPTALKNKLKRQLVFLNIADVLCDKDVDLYFKDCGCDCLSKNITCEHNKSSLRLEMFERDISSLSDEIVKVFEKHFEVREKDDPYNSKESEQKKIKI